METKGHCKHGEFDLREGCAQCIAERKEAELGNTSTPEPENISTPEPGNTSEPEPEEPKADLNDLKIFSTLRLGYVNYCSVLADAHRSSIMVEMDSLPDRSKKYEVGYWKEGLSFVVQFMKDQLKMTFAPPIRVNINGKSLDKHNIAIAVRDALEDILKLDDDSFRFNSLIPPDEGLNIQISWATTPRAWNRLLDERD